MGEATAHAKYAPSGMERVINCPGSTAVIEGSPPSKPKEYTKDGTAAHALAQLCLNNWTKDAGVYLGTDIMIDEDNFEVRRITEKMVDGVQRYIDKVYSYITKEEAPRAPYKFYVEERVSLESLEAGMFGTPDAFIYRAPEKHLIVLDYKNGVKPVVIENNAQMLSYVMGALFKIWDYCNYQSAAKQPVDCLVKKISIVIVQPNNPYEEDREQVWDISPSIAIFWAQHVLIPAIRYSKMEGAALKCGDHCTFCTGKEFQTCPEIAAHAMAVVQTDFMDPVLPDIRLMSPEQRMQLADFYGVVKGLCEDATTFMQHDMEQGVHYPGWKLVKQKSNRKLTPEAEPILDMEFGDDAYTRKLIGVTAAEKLYKDKNGLSAKQAFEAMSLLTVKPDTGVTIAKESDKRPALAPQVDDFLDIGPADDFLS